VGADTQVDERAYGEGLARFGRVWSGGCGQPSICSVMAQRKW
jgi:hypothetical protein